MHSSSYFCNSPQKKHDNHSTQLHYKNVLPTSVRMRSVTHCTHNVFMRHWKTMNHIAVFKAWDSEIKILQNYVCKVHRSGFAECFTFICSDSQLSSGTFKASKRAFILTCCVEVCIPGLQILKHFLLHS